ncbi:globin domain-containing protein [Phenylobacterium sp.]|uniref:globin domain-containing protein n=1 Tax=Phenylobacterium sp. TaxID=1871053 RepID=UPI0035AFF618
MTPDQIELVRSTFAEVAPIRAQAARLFYARLFETWPEIRPMFKTDLAAHGQKLMAAIEVVVDGLERPETIGARLEALGRAGGCAVQPAHYRAMGDTLIWMLETSLGEVFTPQAKAAWIAAYDLLSRAMAEAACEPEPRAA